MYANKAIPCGLGQLDLQYQLLLVNFSATCPNIFVFIFLSLLTYLLENVIWPKEDEVHVFVDQTP